MSTRRLCQSRPVVGPGTVLCSAHERDQADDICRPDSRRPRRRLPPRPNVPLTARALPEEAWSEGVRFGTREIALGKLGGAQKVGVRLERIPPGKQSCPFHYHLRAEEHFYVLEGQCVLRSGDQRFVMKAGDYVCFPAGTGVAYAFKNDNERGRIAPVKPLCAARAMEGIS